MSRGGAPRRTIRTHDQPARNRSRRWIQYGGGVLLFVVTGIGAALASRAGEDLYDGVRPASTAVPATAQSPSGPDLTLSVSSALNEQTANIAFVFPESVDLPAPAPQSEGIPPHWSGLGGTKVSPLEMTVVAQSRSGAPVTIRNLETEAECDQDLASGTHAALYAEGAAESLDLDIDLDAQPVTARAPGTSEGPYFKKHVVTLSGYEQITFTMTVHTRRSCSFVLRFVTVSNGRESRQEIVPRPTHLPFRISGVAPRFEKTYAWNNNPDPTSTQYSIWSVEQP